MRAYGTVYTSFWDSETLQKLDSDSRLLAVYLLTCQHLQMCGAFKLPDSYACEDLGWDSERLNNGFTTLSEAKFIQRCHKTKWVFICKYHLFNKPDNPNQRKSIEKQITQIPASASFKSEIMKIWGVSETVSEPLGNLSVTESVTVTEKKTAKEKKTSMPKDFGISDAVRNWAKEKGHGRLELHLESFKSKCAAHGYKYANWDSAFMEAIRQDWAKLPEIVSGRGGSPPVVKTPEQEREDRITGLRQLANYGDVAAKQKLADMGIPA